MRSSWLKWMFLVILTGIHLVVYSQDANQTWIFEGTISNVDPGLDPDLQNGWVLSGSFSLNRLDLEPEPGPTGEGQGRLASGVHHAEISIDLYHQVHFEARQTAGLAGFDFHNDDLESDGRDLLAWFFPVNGVVKEGKWTSRWLQVWLTDSSGKMIGEVPPVISLNGLEWENAWFRLTFEDDNANTVYVDGRMDVFCPAGEELDESQWRGIAAELSEELIKRDGTILSLREELAAAKDRNTALRQMVDLLVQERANLQEEITRLEQQASLADPRVLEKIDELKVEKSLLSLEIEQLSERNQALAESLARSEQSRLELLSKLEEVQKPVEVPKYVELPKAVRTLEAEPEPQPEVESEPESEPEPESKPEPESDPESEPELDIRLEGVGLEPKTDSKKGKVERPAQRKRGPRKFR